MHMCKDDLSYVGLGSSKKLGRQVWHGQQVRLGSLAGHRRKVGLAEQIGLSIDLQCNGGIAEPGPGHHCFIMGHCGHKGEAVTQHSAPCTAQSGKQCGPVPALTQLTHIRPLQTTQAMACDEELAVVLQRSKACAAGQHQQLHGSSASW